MSKLRRSVLLQACRVYIQPFTHLTHLVAIFRVAFCPDTENDETL